MAPNGGANVARGQPVEQIPDKSATETTIGLGFDTVVLRDNSMVCDNSRAGSAGRSNSPLWRVKGSGPRARKPPVN